MTLRPMFRSKKLFPVSGMSMVKASTIDQRQWCGGQSQHSLSITDVDLKYQRASTFSMRLKMLIPPVLFIQFGDNDEIRLYRFMGETIAESSMNGKHLNDGQLHHVKLVKTKCVSITCGRCRIPEPPI